MSSILENLKGVKLIPKADGSTAYQITVSKGIDPRTGKQCRRYKTFTPWDGMSKREIKTEIEKIRVELGGARTNTNNRESRKTFALYAAELIDRRERSGQYKARTAASYRRLLNVICTDFCNMSLNEITPTTIESFYDMLRRDGSRRCNQTATAKPTLTDYLHKYSITDKELIERSGVARSTWQRIKHSEPVTNEIAARISNALGKRTTDFFVPVVTDEPISERTIQLYAHFIGGVLRSAVKKGLIPDNPVDLADPPEPEHKDTAAIANSTMDQVFRHLSNEPLRWQLTVYLLAITGARRGEIAGLRWDDIDLDQGLIHIQHSLNYTPENGIFLDSTKTKNKRYVKIPPQIIRLLRQYRAEQAEYILACCGQYDNQGYLFTQPDGKPSNPETITAWFCRFSKRHNLHGVHAHAFRHSAASILIANGVDVVTVASMLGHSDPTTTERVYAHALEESRAKAAECITSAIFKEA